jgi:hypothetical protein
VVEYMGKIGLQQVHTEGRTLARGRQRGPARLCWSHPSGYRFRLRLTVGPDRRRRTKVQGKWYLCVRIMLRSTLIHWFSRRVQAGAAKHYSLVQILTSQCAPTRALAAAASGHCCARRRSASSRYPARRRYCSLGTASGSVVLPETIDTNLIAAPTKLGIHFCKIEKVDAN